MTPEWMESLVPAGTSPRKLLLAGSTLVVALGVLAYDFYCYGSDDTPDHDFTVAALELDSPESANATPMNTPSPGLDATGANLDPAATARPVAAGASEMPGSMPAPAPGDGAGAGAGAAPPAGAARVGNEPDWGALFAQLIARESSSPLVTSAGVATVATDSELQALLDGSKLRGVVSTESGGIALINGRLLRIGDTLPGTDLQLTGILADRVLLRVPARGILIPLLLEPMSSRAAAGVP